MANWLEKWLPSSAATRRASLPVKTTVTQNMPLVQLSVPTPPVAHGKLPNATIIYGVAASILFVMAIFNLFAGRWFTAFLILLPAICFLGFALHFLRHPQ